jgi:membrane protease YdiL (CAAX protease family)
LTNEHSTPHRWTPPTIVGLIVALLGPIATYPFAHTAFGTTFSPTRVVIGLVIHWINLAAVVAIVILWERRPLTSIGVVPMRWWTLPVGIVAGFVITFASGILVGTLGLHSDVEFVSKLQSLPVVLRALTALTAGVFEETLFRGYALERLTTLWGNKWLAGACTVVIFTLAHVPAVGWDHVLPVGIVSILVTLLYLWRRDLVLNMVAHTTVDAIGLLLAPLASR